MGDFAFYYVESNIVCVIVFSILLIHNHFSLDRQEKQVKFDRALLAFICYFLADALWAAIMAEILPKTRSTVVADVFLLYIFMTAITYYWLDYVMTCTRVANRDKPFNRLILLFPFILSTAMLVVNYCVAPRLLLDDDLRTLPIYSVYLVTAPIIYIVAILFYTVKKARKTDNRAERRNYLFIGLLPLLSIAGGLVETLFLPYAPIFCFCSMILMLLFYIQSIEKQVSQDPLTGLNNRGQLARYIAQRGGQRGEKTATAVVMIDIDRFKAINDTYGHAEGDQALVIVSDALKRAVSHCDLPAFLGRYGGDEFILILHPAESGDIDRLIGGIRGEIDRAALDRALPYPIRISAGHALQAEGQSLQDCIQRADRQLYLDKARRTRSGLRSA